MARSAARKKKVTFSLNGEIVQEMRELVEKGQSGSQNRFVEQALQEYMKQVRRDVLRRELAHASRDPLFLSDIKQAEKDFAQADTET